MITPAMVKELRESTGCGMMDCKKALTEANGDMEKATEILREKGLAAAQKKAGRIAAEGIVADYRDDNVAALIEVNSETDFVAKNESFVEFVSKLAEIVAKENPKDVEALSELKFDADNTVADALREKILVIGENMNIRRFVRYEGSVATYIHGGGRIGVAVLFDTDVASNPGFVDFGKDIAMQIAAVKPLYVCQSEVPAETVEKEKEILMAQALNEGKPANIAEKMVMGRIAKYYKEVCLVDQEYVKDPDLSVKKYVEAKAKEFGGKIEIKAFARLEKGEGLEKKEDNFADEVANMIK
ncbi:MAG: elongation factor Ts [Clostridia bacterium]|nr:elongation factor Ts [Oscillospiraceae bacterium]MBR4893080.1 elongation factor Ts [Clostridia bacterium]